MANIEREAPSIGGVHLNFDRNGSRVRRISNRVISETYQFSWMLEGANLYANYHDASRRLVRAITPIDAIGKLLPVAQNKGFHVEASIPLSGSFANTAFIYWGHNSSGRSSHFSILEAEKKQVQEIVQKPIKSVHEILQKAHDRGFTLELLTGQVSPEDHADLVAMYEESFTSYPFDIQEQIDHMIADPTILVYAARSNHDGRLYSVAAAEEVQIDLGNGGIFTMWEMGDSAKRKEIIRGNQKEEINGLNAPLKLMLIREAIRSGHNIDLLFCETRAALFAVNRINQSIGMRHYGLLPKHTVISGPSTIPESTQDGEVNGRYGNMNVWALTQDEILRIGNEVKLECSKIW